MEIWKDIQGYEGIYQVSNFGRVKSLARTKIHPSCKDKTILVHEKIRKNTLIDCGYYRVDLHTKGGRDAQFIHRLVAKHFIPNPESNPMVNHKDGIKTNNHVSNLEWCTPTQNMQHARDTGLLHPRQGETHPCAKLKLSDIGKIRQMLNEGYSNIEIAENFKVNRTTINDIKLNRTWKQVA